jgi:tetratricopeptide (TPR) repeat protein
MRTKFLFTIAFACTTFAFAQKKEVKVVEKAVKSGNYGAAKAALPAAEALIGAMDEKTKTKFLLLKGQSYLGVDSKNVEDLTKAAAAFNDLKDSKYNVEAENGLRNVVAALVNAAVEDQNSQKPLEAAKKLEQAYSYSKKDTSYLYFAASNAVNAKDWDTSLRHYKTLRDLKYTGIETKYYATDAETGEESAYNKQERDLLVRATTHVKPREENSESRAAEIAKNIALIYITKGDNDKALEAMETARIENPGDKLLLRSEADIYLKMGKMDKYQEVITQVLNNADEGEKAELYYNLGVSADQQGDKVKAREYYGEAIARNESYTAAYNNLAVLILAKEKALVDEMNALGTSKADYKRYDELSAEREGVYREAMPYLEKALENAKPEKSLSVARSLYGIYQQLDMQDKADIVKAKIDALEGGN